MVIECAAMSTSFSLLLMLSEGFRLWLARKIVYSNHRWTRCVLGFVTVPF